MELQLTEEQTAFVETVRRFLAAECPMSAVRALEHYPYGFDRAVWQRAAGLGWTSLLVSEAHGGGSLTEYGLADLAFPIFGSILGGFLGIIGGIVGAIWRIRTRRREEARYAPVR